MTAVNASGRVPGVDGLRGLSALGVAWFHLYTQNGGHLLFDTAPRALTLVSIWSQFGMRTLFLISGFGVAYSLIGRADIRGPKDVAIYLVRRSIRIDPSLLVAMALTMALVPILPVITPTPRYPAYHWSWPEVLSNLFYFVKTNHRLYVPVAWALGIEMMFYTLFAMMMVAINQISNLGVNRDKVVIGVVGVLVAVSGLEAAKVLNIHIGYWDESYLHSFVLGICFALVLRRYAGAWPLLSLCVAVHIAALAAGSENTVFASLVATAAIMAAVLFKPLTRVLDTRPFVFLGSVSFGVILLHELIGGAVVEYIQRVYAAPGLAQLPVIILGLGATILAAIPLRRFVEVHCIQLARRFGPAPAPRVAPAQLRPAGP